MLDFTPLDGKDAVAVNEMSHLATDIVREHFDPLIGKAQNDYMLARFQTPQAIEEQTAHGSRYYFVRENGQDADFVAFYPRDGKMYLSKFYLKKEMRGKGYAHEMLSFVLDETKKAGLPAVFLNVNRYNDACRAYEALGFTVARYEVNDIGNGFVMDDAVYEYTL